MYLKPDEKLKTFSDIKKVFSDAYIFVDCYIMIKKLYKPIDKAEALEADFVVSLSGNVIDSYCIAHCTTNNNWCYCFFSRMPYPQLYYVCDCEFVNGTISDSGMYDDIKSLLNSKMTEEIKVCGKGTFLNDAQKQEAINVCKKVYTCDSYRIYANSLTAVPNPFNNGWSYVDFIIGEKDMLIAHDIKNDEWILLIANESRSFDDLFMCYSWHDTLEELIEGM